MKKIKIISLGILILAVFLIWVRIIEAKSGDFLKIVFFDIGQGDAIFLETPNHTQALFDGGPDSSVLNRLGKAMPLLDRTLDFIFVSHPDQDHIAGLISVFDKYKVLNVVVSGVESDTQVYQTLLQRIKKENANFITATGGQVFDFNDGVLVRIFFPDRPATNFETNTGSLITQIDFNDIEVMLTGDSPQAIEKYLIDLYGDKLQSEILKAGHHGSKTSNSEGFLKIVNPEFFVISVGADNKYGHPNQQVLDILDKLNLSFLRTDERGDIKFFSDGIKIWR